RDGDRGVDGVAARTQDVDPGLGRHRMISADRTVAAHDQRTVAAWRGVHRGVLQHGKDVSVAETRCLASGRNRYQVGSIGMRAMPSQAIGAPAFSAACAAGNDVSPSAAMKRLPLTLLPSSDSSHSSGGTMIVGLSILSRSGAFPTSGVSVVPPGTSTLDVIPLPARSAARIAIADSYAALDDP